MSDLLIRNATVWSSPDVELLPGQAIVIRSGQIERVVPMAALDLPAETLPEWDAEGRVVTAGFWNCHVHLTGQAWAGAGRAPADRLQAALDDMLLSRGFTTAIDLASDSRSTLALLERIASGELRGPTILTATEAIHPTRGLPFYTREAVPWFLHWALPTPWTAAGAGRVARRQIRKGARVLKLFTGSYVERDRVKPMGVPQARAAVEVAHGHGLLVFAHTSNREGLQAALESGVDVVAHVPDETDGTHALLRDAARRGVRLVPTLHMFAATVTTSRDYLDPIDDALRTFRDAGGRILFGTDVGYLTDYSTDGELAALDRCGVDHAAILQSLTVDPAAAFGRVHEGRIGPGMRADLTVLDVRIVTSATDLGRIAAVVKDGRVVFRR